MSGLRKNSPGFGIIELVIASAIISGSLFSLMSVFSLSNRLAGEASNKIRANFIAEEGLEAARILRDAGWNHNIAPLLNSETYYLDFDTATLSWDIVTTDPGFIGGKYSRKIKVQDVSRDSFADIVASGGTVDLESKKIIVEVSWFERGGTKTQTLSTYLFDVFDN